MGPSFYGTLAPESDGSRLIHLVGFTMDEPPREIVVRSEPTTRVDPESSPHCPDKAN
ncbi:MAG: hypothetical protein JJLCMIEE_01626 [Acidimicrobiales bacterium]|nr:hypothetical protein [Acidimicrobiales bacterium]